MEMIGGIEKKDLITSIGIFGKAFVAIGTHRRGLWLSKDVPGSALANRLKASNKMGF